MDCRGCRGCLRRRHSRTASPAANFASSATATVGCPCLPRSGQRAAAGAHHGPAKSSLAGWQSAAGTRIRLRPPECSAGLLASRQHCVRGGRTAAGGPQPDAPTGRAARGRRQQQPASSGCLSTDVFSCRAAVVWQTLTSVAGEASSQRCRRRCASAVATPVQQQLTAAP